MGEKAQKKQPATVFEKVRDSLANTLVGYDGVHLGIGLGPKARTVGMMFSAGMAGVLDEMTKNAIRAMQNHILPTDDGEDQ